MTSSIHNRSYLEARIANYQKLLEELDESEHKFGCNSDYETGTILVWFVADGNHTVTAVKHSSGVWNTSYNNEASYTFGELTKRIADRPCFVVTEITALNDSGKKFILEV